MSTFLIALHVATSCFNKLTYKADKGAVSLGELQVWGLGTSEDVADPSSKGHSLGKGVHWSVSERLKTYKGHPSSGFLSRRR